MVGVQRRERTSPQRDDQGCVIANRTQALVLGSPMTWSSMVGEQFQDEIKESAGKPENRRILKELG